MRTVIAPVVGLLIASQSEVQALHIKAIQQLRVFDEDPLDLSMDVHTNADKDVISYTQNVAEGKKFGKKQAQPALKDSSDSPFYMAMDANEQKDELKQVEASLAQTEEQDVDDSDMLMLEADINKASSEDEQKAIDEARDELLKPEKVNEVQVETASEVKTNSGDGNPVIEDKMVEILDQSRQELTEKYQNATQNATAAADVKAELDEKVAESVKIHIQDGNSQENKDQKALNE